MGPDQTGSTLFVKDASKTFQQMTFVVIATLKVNKSITSLFHNLSAMSRNH